MASNSEIPVESAFRMMFNQIAARFAEGDALFLSSDFQLALRQVREDNFGVLDSFQGTPGIDLSKLHRSERVKSGFVGVYANGQGFRAMAEGKRSIGTFKTAEEAAWRRYLYYRANGLPYGEFEEEFQEWRLPKRGGIEGFKGSDEELTKAIWELHQHTGMRDRIFGPNLENVPERLRAAISASTPAPVDRAEAQARLTAVEARMRQQVAKANQPPIEPAGGVPMSVFDDQEDS